MSKSEYKLTQHPISLLFPCPDIGTINRIKHSVFKSKGVKRDDVIITLEGQVIKGWEEYSACLEFKLPYVANEFSGVPEALADFLLSMHNSQLSKQHRALIGAYLKKFYRSQAKANQSAAGKKAPHISPLHARDAAAGKVKISPRMISHAEKIINSGNEKLLGLVRDGTVSVANGAKIAGMDSEKIQDFFSKVEQAKLEGVAQDTPDSRLNLDDIEQKREKNLRVMEQHYKDKRSKFNDDMRQRLELADTPEEKEEIKLEINLWRKEQKHIRQKKEEEINQKYEAAKHDIFNQDLAKEKLRTKILINDIVQKRLKAYEMYMIYLRWDYEMGELKLRAVAEKYSKARTHGNYPSTVSGKKVNQNEMIAICTDMSDAESICQNINEQNFCQDEIALLNDQMKQHLDEIGNDFMAQVKSYMDEDSE